MPEVEDTVGTVGMVVVEQVVLELAVRIHMAKAVIMFEVLGGTGCKKND
jgi:hypothetical protein